jgi:transcriptional regulator with XRE-family HTH domain
MKTLAERIKQERARLGLNQKELAKLIGKGQSFIGNLESGARTETALIPELAKVFGVSALWLKTGKPDSANNDGKQSPAAEEPAPPPYAEILPTRIQQLLAIAKTMDDSGLDKLVERATVLAEMHPKQVDKNRVA